MLKYTVVALMSLALAVPAFGTTHKETYPNACSEVWAAVKDTLSDPVNYNVKQSDDATMSAFFQPKHSVHVTVTGALLQRTNSVILHSKGLGCEMQVKSNYSGFEHNDSGDFKKRVEESLAKPKGPASAEPVKPADEKK